MSYAADYLTAIGLPEAIGTAPTLELLQTIYAKHCESLAFCTTRLLAAEPLSQDPAAALQVLALDKRGGVCCELYSPALCSLVSRSLSCLWQCGGYVFKLVLCACTVHLSKACLC
jgi:arylamine N-acetyltransferase